MRIVKFLADGRARVGAYADEAVEEFAGIESIGAALSAWLANPASLRRARSRRWPRDEVQLLAPVDASSRVFAIAQNYPTHAAEMGGERPPAPVFFLKLPTALAPPDAEVEIPWITKFFDYEGELGVLIGRAGRDIRKDRALDHVGGYTICNDGTARDLQATVLGGKPLIDWFSAKTIDGTGPVGPWVVTRDEVPDPQDLALSTRLNGETVQNDRTSSMVFSIAEQIAYISERLELRTGDLIESGTPGGVGKARGRALRPGDRVEIEVERVGVLRSRYTEPRA